MSEPYSHEPALALLSVKVRIDDQSMSGSQWTNTLRPNVLCVAGSQIFLTVGLHPNSSISGTCTFNLASGDQVDRPEQWIAFSKCSLVWGEGEEEQVLMKYDFESK